MNDEFKKVVALSWALLSPMVFADTLPRDVLSLIPAGHRLLVHQAADFDANGVKDYALVAVKTSEARDIANGDPPPARWLLIVMGKPRQRYELAARNDSVVFDGGQARQCDPFVDSGRLSVQGAYITVENGVSCGEHWTDFITFKYDKETGKFLFHKRIFEAWSMNDSAAPDADALVLTARKVTTGKRLAPVELSRYHSPQ